MQQTKNLKSEIAMKITKRQLRQIIKEEKIRILNEEPSDYYRDYRAGSISYAEYQQLVRDYEQRTGGGSYSRPRRRRKTTYVGADANAEQIAAVEAALKKKPNKFLSSVLDQLVMGRGLSAKQKSIVRKILMKSDKQAAALFEGVINEGNAAVDYMIGYEDARDELPMNSDDGYYQIGYADYLNGNHDDYEALVKDQKEPPYVREGKDMHRCMDGSMVPTDSQDCLSDVVSRIDDAMYFRGHNSCGTEDRVYYNGLLKSLRRKRNRLQKMFEPADEDIVVIDLDEEI